MSRIVRPNLIQQRLGQDTRSTVSTLTLNTELRGVDIGPGTVLCWILEDRYRAVKVRGQTRVPACLARMVRVRRSGILTSMRRWFPGMGFIVGLEDIPGFRLVRCHTGNDDGDTEGCPIVGQSALNSWCLSPRESTIAASRSCYKALHNRVFVPMFEQVETPGWLILDEPRHVSVPL